MIKMNYTQARPEGGSPPSKMGGPGPRGAREGPQDRRKKRKEKEKKKERRKKEKEKKKKKRRKKEEKTNSSKTPMPGCKSWR